MTTMTNTRAIGLWMKYLNLIDSMTKDEAIKLMSRTRGVTPETMARDIRKAREMLHVKPDSKPERITYPGRQELQINDGVVIAGSDAHIWPGPWTTAMQGMLFFMKKYHNRLRAVIWNGDFIDAPKISRYPPINWETLPTVAEELAAVKAYADATEDLVGTDIPLYWTLGNHDARFETRLAQKVPEFEGTHGFHLKDHFPAWNPGWSLVINDSVVFKHRFKGGAHAAYNNTKECGRTCVTGHTHRALVRPFTDYNGTRFGVDLGMLAEPWGHQFEYLEDGTRDWRQSFGVFEFRNGKMLQPQLAMTVGDGVMDFCGELYDVAQT